MDEEPPAPGNEAPADVEPPAPPPPRSRWRRYLPIGSVILLLLVAGGWGVSFWQHWNAVGTLEPSGGLYFFRRTELPVPLYRQGDSRWREDLLGPTPGTIGAEGCAITSAAMVMSYYGVDTDPQRLNEYLNAHDGYTPEGWVYWEKAAELAPDRLRKAWEDPGSYKLLDENLRRGNPVIVKLRLRSGTTHFVVIAGKSGYDYLIRDPGAGAGKGLYPLKELGSKIYGLRFYEKLKP